MRTLLIGIGNGSRGDDALGWLFLKEIEEKDHGRFELEYRYQLQVEDADLISKYERVLFVDATEEHLPDGFIIKKCEPANSYFFSSHLQSPETVLYLSKSLYHHTPEAFVLPIKGYKWELGEPLSRKANEHLKKALGSFRTSVLYEEAKINVTEKEEQF